MIVHIRIDEKNRLREKASLAKEFASKANLIEGGSNKPLSLSQQNFLVWEKGNKVCRYTILITLSNELFNIYSNCKIVKEIWDYYIKNT